MYFIGAASPAPAQIHDRYYYGTLPRADERRRLADLYADGRWGQLPLVIDHGSQRTPDVPPIERIGHLLWVFVGQDDRIMAVGHVDAGRREMPALLHTLREGRRWGLSFGTTLDPDPARNAVRDIQYAHLGVTMNPDGGDATRIQQFGSDVVALRRVLRESYADAYMPGPMVAWLRDSEARDTMKYTGGGGLAHRSRNFTSPPSFVTAMADSLPAGTVVPPPATPQTVPPPIAPAQTLAPPPLSPEAIAIQRKEALDKLDAGLPGIEKEESIVKRHETLVGLNRALASMAKDGIFDVDHVLHHPTLQRVQEATRKANVDLAAMKDKYFTYKMANGWTQEQLDRTKQTLVNPLSDAGRFVLADAESTVRSQSQYERDMAEKEEKRNEEITTLKRKLDDYEKKAAAPAPATLPLATATPAAIHAGSPSLSQQLLNQSTAAAMEHRFVTATAPARSPEQDKIGVYLDMYMTKGDPSRSAGSYELDATMGSLDTHFGRRQAAGDLPFAHRGTGKDGVIVKEDLLRFVGHT